MREMFRGAFNQPLNVWDVSSVTRMDWICTNII